MASTAPPSVWAVALGYALSITGLLTSAGHAAGTASEDEHCEVKVNKLS